MIRHQDTGQLTNISGVQCCRNCA